MSYLLLVDAEVSLEDPHHFSDLVDGCVRKGHHEGCAQDQPGCLHLGLKHKPDRKCTDKENEANDETRMHIEKGSAGKVPPGFTRVQSLT